MSKITSPYMHYASFRFPTINDITTTKSFLIKIENWDRIGWQYLDQKHARRNFLKRSRQNKFFVQNANAEFDISEDFEDVDTDSISQISELPQCIEQ